MSTQSKKTFPVIHNPCNTEAAAKYAASIEARKQTEPTLQKKGPPIPRLDQPHIEGLTMADQARLQRKEEAPVSTMHRTQNAALLATDVLPEQAKSDPAFLQGAGNMYAVNQPNLAYKYGVIRNGKFVSPSTLISGQPNTAGGLSQETLQGLEQIAKINQQRQHVESGEAAVEEASERSLAGEVAKYADPSPDPSAKPLSNEEVEEALKKMDDFDFDTLRGILMKDILNNQDQRQIVEDRLTPLDLAEIIEKGVITQRIPIVPDQWEPTLQSVTAQEELALKRLLMEEVGTVKEPNRYILDKYQLMAITVGIYAINGRVVPDHRDKNGDFSDEAFWTKFNFVLRLPYHMLASIAVHYHYFDIRVRSLFKAIKNG